MTKLMTTVSTNCKKEIAFSFLQKMGYKKISSNPIRLTNGYDKVVFSNNLIAFSNIKDLIKYLEFNAYHPYSLDTVMIFDMECEVSVEAMGYPINEKIHYVATSKDEIIGVLIDLIETFKEIEELPALLQKLREAGFGENTNC